MARLRGPSPRSPGSGSRRPGLIPRGTPRSARLRRSRLPERPDLDRPVGGGRVLRGRGGFTRPTNGGPSDGQTVGSEFHKSGPASHARCCPGLSTVDGLGTAASDSRARGGQGSPRPGALARHNAPRGSPSVRRDGSAAGITGAFPAVPDSRRARSYRYSGGSCSSRSTTRSSPSRSWLRRPEPHRRTAESGSPCRDRPIPADQVRQP